MTQRSVTHATFVVEATVDLKPAGKGTNLTFTEQGAFLDGFDDAAGRERGTVELLDALGAELKRQSEAD